MNRSTPQAPTLGKLADELASLEAEAKALSDREDGLQAELDRVVAAYDATTERLKAARLRVVAAVLERASVSLPGIVDWHFRSAPLAVVRDGEKTYILAALIADDFSSDLPSTREQLAQRVSLIVC